MVEKIQRIYIYVLAVLAEYVEVGGYTSISFCDYKPSEYFQMPFM